jgi:4-diphosphocytidyl-2-C-methyl-D-erythritol kinase
MVSFPPCKINLGLNIIEKRSDGYHNLETVFYPIPLCDIVEVIPSDTVQFIASGLTIPGESSTNLCLKAYNLLKAEHNLDPVEIHLHKVIPTGAGLGGGSADAAHTLRLLNQLFKLELSNTELQHYAQQLGSDCAFFIEDKPMLGLGRGEILAPVQLTLKGKFLVLVKPDVHVSTAEAYRGVKPVTARPQIKDIIESIPLQEWKDVLKNDFEESVFKAHPIISQYKENLYAQGAIYACMSGSGSSVFGIFEKAFDFEGEDVIWSGLLTH